MASPYGRTDQYTPDPTQQSYFTSPVPLQQPWSSNYDFNRGDLGTLEFGAPPRQQSEGPQFEMARKPVPTHRGSGNSFASMGSPQSAFTSGQPTPSETQSFLHDPMNKVDIHNFSTSNYQPYKDRTGRQLRHILYASSSRLLITIALFAAYILCTIVWVKKGAVTESSKRIFNALTTAISLAVGLNIATAFKDMALNMRWPILNNRKRNLKELDMILRADSLTELSKLVFMARRFWVVTACLAWLFINIAAQACIAMLGLTYGFEVDYDAVLQSKGNIEVPDMAHFYPETMVTQPEISDEQNTAHAYGALAGTYYGVDTLDKKPKPGDIYKPSNPMLWHDASNNLLEFVFSNAPQNVSNSNQFASYTERTVNVTWACESHPVLNLFDGLLTVVEVQDVGNVTINTIPDDSLIYFTDDDNLCSDDNRCAIVQALEASTIQTSYYYKCEITVGNTQNDSNNISFIGWKMAYYAAAAIAQIGYIDNDGQAQQFYPNKSSWGLSASGDANLLGKRISMYALGSIAGAALFNPSKIVVGGLAPHQAFHLTLGHSVFFYLIIGCICGTQLIFCVVVAVVANRVKVGPEGHLSMSLLMRPIADALEGVSGGRETQAYHHATKEYSVKYEKARNGRWVFSLT